MQDIDIKAKVIEMISEADSKGHCSWSKDFSEEEIERIRYVFSQEAKGNNLILFVQVERILEKKDLISNSYLGINIRKNYSDKENNSYMEENFDKIDFESFNSMLDKTIYNVDLQRKYLIELPSSWNNETRELFYRWVVESGRKLMCENNRTCYISW